MNDNNREYISIGANSQPQTKPVIRKRSLFSLMLNATAVVLILFVVVLFAAGTEKIDREEGELLQYGTEQYSEIFGSSSAPEDNILFVFLLDEYDFEYSSSMGIVGDNINSYIHIMFEEYEDYYDAFERFLDHDNVGAFGEDYVEIINYMTANIMAHEFYRSFKTPSDRSNLVPSGIINKTGLAFNENDLAAALDRFTEKTDIPCVLLIEYESVVYSDVETVFDKVGTALVMLLMLLIPVTVVVAIVTFIKRKNGNIPSGARVTLRGLSEKCGKDGCDGRVGRDERPPWEYD